MANHKNAIKEIRKADKKRVHNKYYHKTTRNVVKDLRETTDPKEAQAELAKAASMLDKLVKKNIIHKNKAANLKSGLAKKINSLKK